MYRHRRLGASRNGKISSRHPRRGRRAKARARREHWEQANQESLRDNDGGSERRMLGTLLACIEEDEGGDHKVDREGDIMMQDFGF